MTARPSARVRKQAARYASIERALEIAKVRGTVLSWQRVNGQRPWLVLHRGHCAPGGDLFTTHDVEAFCKGLAAAEYAHNLQETQS